MTEPWARETEHALKALDSRAGCFQLPDTAKILAPINDAIQEIEDVFWQIFDARFVASAEDYSLEILGAIVGESRLGDGDDDLRLRIRLKLRAIRSTKRAIDFIELLQLLEGSTFVLQEQPGWVIVVQTGGTPVKPSTLFNALHVCSADGVLVRLESYEDAEDDLFFWPSADGEIGGASWGSADATISGAAWPGVTE